MNTTLLEYIVAIAETKSVSRAAERCYISQSLLSKHLTKLEDSLGVQLFRRENKGMSLTPAGIIFVNNAQAILHAEHQLESRLAAIRRQQRDSLRILIDAPYHNFFVRRILPRFRRLHPEFHIDFAPTYTGQAQHLLRKGQADLSIFATHTLNSPELEFLRVSSDEMVLVFPDADGAPAPKLSELKGMFDRGQIIGLHENGAIFRSLEDSWLKEQGLSPKSVLEFDTFRSLLMAMEMQQCCALFPKQLAINHKRARVISASPPFVFHVVVSYLKDMVFTAPARDFLKAAEYEFSRFHTYVAAHK